MKYIVNKDLFGRIVILLQFFVVVSCNSDFLERPPLGTLDEDTYLSTENAGYKLLVNCYQPIVDHWNYQTMKFDMGDQLTDDCSKGGSDAGDRVRITELTRGNPLTTNEMITDLWNHRFKTAISNCNVFLNLITPDRLLIETGGALVTEEKKKRWIAEAHFLRAFYYFDLAMMFANVPIIDKPLNVIDKSTITRADASAVKEFILNDLSAAIQSNDLPKAAQLPLDEVGRVTHEAAQAFRARVNLFFNEYESAKNDLKEVIDSQAYDLIDNYEDLFNSAEKGYLSKESVFITLRSYIPNYTGGSVCPQMNIGRGAAGGWGGQCPTNDLVSEFEEGDPRLVHSVLSSGDIMLKADGVKEVHDYSGYDNYAKQHSRKQYPDWSRRPVNSLLDTDWTFYHIRYADVLLMYAETLLETGGDKQTVVDILNKIRYRAFVTSPKSDSFAFYRKFNIPEDKVVTPEIFEEKYKVKISDDLKAAVRHERRVELAGEGMRLYDLLRWKMFVPTMQAFGKTAEGIYSGAGTIVTDKTWPYPIPQNEIDFVGGALLQNDNYR